MQQRQEIVYFDRYQQTEVTEEIYGEAALRWAYETGAGRGVLHSIIRKPWFSSLYGKWADCRCSRREVAKFIEQFNLDITEFKEPPESFSTFNDFFSRELLPSARPVDPDDSSVIFPADGRHLFLPDLSKVEAVYAKGQPFPLSRLIGNDSLTEEFRDGSALLSRLCPTDYHRYHFPVSGLPEKSILLNGPLYSVNPIALRRSIRYACENKRQLTVVRESPVGKYLFLEVGATNVGTIIQTAQPESPVLKGDEKGFFRFGGSMVITLFQKGKVTPASDLLTQSSAGIELYARMGDRMGVIAGSK